MNPVENALRVARNQLALLNGGHIQTPSGNGNGHIHFFVDNSEAIATIDNALAWLDSLKEGNALAVK